MIIGEKAVLLPFDEKYLAQVRKWVNQPDVRAGTGTEGPVSDYNHSRWYQRLMDDLAQRTYIIGEAAKRRRGLASEATSLIMDFGFNTLGLHRIYLQVLENNLPALGMYRKLGFFQEGVAREHLFSQGKFVNVIQFSILEHEFIESLTPSGSR